ncbi:MAG: DUF4143 domain-containing protein [Paludibacteraceae bacterium]|nr:DUF4143 domain-containing protein [Paludibacteraceae bacterium]
MEVQDYKPRVCDKELSEQLEAAGAVLIEGAKWCGKTYTGRNAANSVLFMQDRDRSNMYKQMAATKPSLLLDGESPRLLDEWEEAPVLWDAVRFTVDMRGKMGQFILTGSAVPKEDKSLPENERRMHSGTGRIVPMRMRTMSLWESDESTGQVSLETLFNHPDNDLAALSNLTIEQLAFSICRGGWPASIRLTERAALRTARNYVEDIINLDIHRVDGVEKNPLRVRKLLESLARNISTMTTNETIMADIRATDQTLSPNTYATYMNALRRIFIVDDVPAWSPALRSKTTIRSSAKRHFVDPSVAAALLRISPFALLHDFKTFGFLFEDLCARDLRVYAQALDGEVFHYHDKKDLECDLVIVLHDGRWAAVEVKLGANEEELAAKNLLSLAKDIDEQRMNSPSFLMILTGGQFAYRRKDGIFVVPIGCLKP